MTVSVAITKPRFKTVIGRANALTQPYSIPPIPIKDIVEKYGVSIEFTPFPGHEEEISGFCDFKSKKLYINQNDPINKQTFTIAHEFGHWTLHREFYLAHPEKYPFFPRFKSPDKNNPFEQEANFFAANMLVPEHILKPVKEASVAALSTAFAVSKEMMEIRLQNVRRFS